MDETGGTKAETQMQSLKYSGIKFANNPRTNGKRAH